MKAPLCFPGVIAEARKLARYRVQQNEDGSPPCRALFQVPVQLRVPRRKALPRRRHQGAMRDDGGRVLRVDDLPLEQIPQVVGLIRIDLRRLAQRAGGLEALERHVVVAVARR